jgi:nucleotide-binding universal stress UspA family protein
LFSRVLVAIDGSEPAKKAFAKSIFLSAKCNSKLDVVYVIQCELGGDGATTFEIIDELKRKAMKILEEYKNKAIKNSLQIKTIIKVGDPAKIITDIANSKNYDLIIMGNRGMSAFKELLLGSVSQKVIHHARCPVMIVR